MDQDLKNSILKTGTTILGIVCKDGIVMAADRQVTGGTVVVAKKEKKVFRINDFLVLAGCGVTGDIQRVPKFIAAELRLKELRSHSRPTVKQAASLLSEISYQGIRQPSMIPQQAGFLISGFNTDGSFELYTVEPAGSLIRVEDFDANFGSGMPFVYGLLERQYKKGMSVKEGMELAKESLKSSMQRDVGTGFGIDVFVVTKDKIEQVVEEKVKEDFIKSSAEFA